MYKVLTIDRIKYKLSIMSDEMVFFFSSFEDYEQLFFRLDFFFFNSALNHSFDTAVWTLNFFTHQGALFYEVQKLENQELGRQVPGYFPFVLQGVVGSSSLFDWCWFRTRVSLLSVQVNHG